MRLGWIIAPAEIVPDIGRLREAFDLETSTLMQRSVHEFLQRGWLTPHLEALNEANGLRREALLGALDNCLGDIATWTEPEGGIFVWVTLPEHLDTF